jgi:hypothetical protein
LAGPDPKVETMQNFHLTIAGIKIIDADYRCGAGESIEM